MKRIVFVLAAMALLSACNSNKSKYDAEGFFESTEITISAQSTGNIMALDIREGDAVSEDVVLGYIDTTQLYLNKLQLAKNIESINSNRPDIKKQIAALETQIKKLTKERSRIENMLRDGAATSKQLDDIESQIEIVNNQLEAQKSSLSKSTLSLDAQSLGIATQIDIIDDKLEKCKIKSPIDGTVLAKYAQAGEFTTMGKPLFKVADTDNVYLRAYVTSGQLCNIKLGDHVALFADFGGDNIREYSGTIEWISAKSEFTPKNIQTDNERENLVYAIKVAVKNDGYIKLGMYGGIKF